jgi:hypothetical protein
MQRNAILRGARARNAAVGLLSLALLGTGATAASAAEIIVSWTSVQHEIRPRQATWRVAVNVRLTLRGGNTISESTQSESGQRRTGSTREGQFRQAIAGGQNRVNVTWRVQDARTLVRTSDLPQHTLTVRVTTTADTSCTASVSYRLKPGFREYRGTRISNGEPTFMSAMHAEEIRCAISN